MFNRVILEVLLDDFEVLIGRGIVNDDYLVVSVVLIEDGAQVILISKVLHIVNGGYDYAEGLLG